MLRSLVGSEMCIRDRRYVCGHVPHIALVCRRIPYHTELCLLAYTLSYRAMSASVYRTVRACLQVYAIQCYVCGHVPYIAFVCRCVPYHTELCLQAYTVQCLSAGVCHTALCLRACTIHRACLLVYTISYRAMSASVHRTGLVCRCMPYSALSAGMYRTSCLSVGVYHIIRSYVCRRIPCHTELCLQAYTVQCLSAGVCHTVLCLRACIIHRVCL